MEVHLVDGTYELFRHYYAVPSARDAGGQEVARRSRRGGVAASAWSRPARRTWPWPPTTSSSRSATGCGAATRPAPASSRRCSRSSGCSKRPSPRLGIVVWPMVEFEADDALAAGAVAASADPRVERVVICTPDKDLAQSVRGTRVVQLNRRTRVVMDEAGVDRQVRRGAGLDPRLPRAGRRLGRRLSRAAGLGRQVGGRRPGKVRAPRVRFRTIRASWHVNVASAGKLALTLAAERERAMLFRTLATLRTDIPLFTSVDELEWKGATPAFEPLAARFDAAVRKSARRCPAARFAPTFNDPRITGFLGFLCSELSVTLSRCSGPRGGPAIAEPERPAAKRRQ